MRLGRTNPGFLFLLVLGACSHRCGDGKKTDVDAGSFGPPVAVVVDASALADALVAPIKGIAALAVDDRFIYAASTDKQRGGIYRIPKTGGGQPEQIEKDPVRVMTAVKGSVYYVLAGQSDVMVWPGDSSLTNDFTGTALTTDGKYVYYAHTDRIERFPLFGKWDQWSRRFEPGEGPEELTVCGDRLYWFTSDNASSTVFGLDTTKHDAAARVVGLAHTFVSTLGCDAEYLYLSLHQDPRMGRAPRSLPLRRVRHDSVQTPVETPSGGFGSASAIIIDERALYACFHGTIVKYDKTNFTAKRLFEGNGPLSGGGPGFGPSRKTPMMVDATHVYWAADDGLYRVRKD